MQNASGREDGRGCESEDTHGQARRRSCGVEWVAHGAGKASAQSGRHNRRYEAGEEQMRALI